MKVTGLLLIALGIVSHANAQRDYQLQCSREEMGIRWPSYKSNSEYYVCHRLGDRPMIVNCDDGEVFTFVLQVCTSPSRYIPAPTLDVLPISSPNAGMPFTGHAVRPPLLETMHDHHNNENIPHPPMMTVDSGKPPTEVDVNVQEEEHKPHHPVKPHKPSAKPPMPPTPAPTPPLVDNVEATKKPLSSLGKKPSSPKKIPSKKAPSKSGKGSKKIKPSESKTGKKAPKKAPKKTLTLAKKTPKTSKTSKGPKALKAAKGNIKA